MIKTFIASFLKKIGLLSEYDSDILPPKSKKAQKREKIKNIKKVKKNKSVNVISRGDHNVSRAQISDNALKVLYRLHRKGYEAYLVGGGVRDLLLGLHPKDFDIVTNAKPEEIRSTFRNCRLIGRRFRLAHIYFGYDIVEVATFRAKGEEAAHSATEHAHSDQGMILRDNVYGTIEEDVWRRDFTINALYYNIADFSIVDYVNGFADLKAKRLRMIGDTAQRYREDPVRMLRAIRFASKLDFTLSDDLTHPMRELKHLLGHVAPARLFEEMLKMFHSGAASTVYEKLKKYDLFEELFPITYQSLEQDTYPTDKLLQAVFANTDERIQQQKSVTPAFIIAALLWHPICLRAQEYIKDGMAFFPARTKAIEELLQQQSRRLSIPKRIVQTAREIWMLQMRLPKRHGKKADELMEELRFRAGFDFLELRAKAGEPIHELVKWWQEYIEAEPSKKRALIKLLSENTKNKKSKKSKKKVATEPPSVASE